MAFGGALHFDEMTAAQHHDVHIGVARGVLDVIQIEHRCALVDADRDRGNKILERGFLDQPFAEQAAHRIMQCDERAGDTGGAGAAVSLNHVAINLDGALAQFSQIHHRAQAASDQALDFLGASGLLALGGFPAHAFTGGARQHAVFRGDPAFAAAPFMRRNFFFDAGGANNFGVAALDQHRTFGVFGVVAGDAYFT